MDFRSPLEKVAMGAGIIVLGWVAFKLAIWCLSMSFSILGLIIKLGFFFVIGWVALKIIRKVFD